MDDTKIIELFWQRSGDAIDETDKKYGRMCRRLAGNILGDARDGEECVSDAYMAVWQSIPTQRPARFAAFLAAVTRRLSIDRLRENTAAKRGGGEMSTAIDELAECLAASGTVEAAAIDRFLDGLKEADRSFFVCRYWLGAPIAEIAKRRGVSESRVKSSLMRSRDRLRTYLSEEGYI